MSKNSSGKKTRIFTPILWCLVEVMWIITLICDLIYDVVKWVMVMHAVVAVVCLIIAVIYIISFAKAKKNADIIKEAEKIKKEQLKEQKSQA